MGVSRYSLVRFVVVLNARHTRLASWLIITSALLQRFLPVNRLPFRSFCRKKRNRKKKKRKGRTRIRLFRRDENLIKRAKSTRCCVCTDESLRSFAARLGPGQRKCRPPLFSFSDSLFRRPLSSSFAEIATEYGGRKWRGNERGEERKERERERERQKKKKNFCTIQVVVRVSGL